MSEFQKFGLESFITDKLLKQGISSPTPIQSQAIPLAMSQKDILGSAETGSGKTIAFAAPIIHQLYQNSQSQAVVIAPTRELAEQIAKNMRTLVPEKISIALLIGGAPIFKQLQQLRRSPQIIVGTPGRMIDHLNRGKLNMKRTTMLVLDETDRMLDMGFSEQINELLDETSSERQTMLFSATMPKSITRIANQYLNDPVRIEIGQASKPSENIKQSFTNVGSNDKLPVLLSEISNREGSMIVFVKTKIGADKLALNLQNKGIKADAIHGDLRHGKRQRVIRAFHQKRYRVLVATDVAARGLDIPHIEHVVNFDLPQCPEDYVHRIGRTGRGGNKGESLCFVTQKDQFKLRQIKRFMSLNETSEENNRKSPRRSDNASKFQSKKFVFKRKFTERDGDRPSDGRSKRRFTDRDGDRPSDGRFKRKFSDRDGDRPSDGRFKRKFSDRDGDKPSDGRFKRKFEDRDGDRPSDGRFKRKFADRDGDQSNDRRSKRKFSERDGDSSRSKRRFDSRDSGKPTEGRFKRKHSEKDGDKTNGARFKKKDHRKGNADWSNQSDKPQRPKRKKLSLSDNAN